MTTFFNDGNCRRHSHDTKDMLYKEKLSYKFCTLKWVFHDAILEVFKVILETFVPFLQDFGTLGKLRGEINRPVH